MINTKDPKVKEIMDGMHEAMLRKIKRGSQVKEEIVRENRIFSLICEDFDVDPTGIAVRMNHRYGYDMTGNEVIQILRGRRMANPRERKELFLWADRIATFFAGAMQGKAEQYQKFEKTRREPALKNGKKHDSQERIANIMIYKKYPEIDAFDDTGSLHLLGNTLARYLFYDISDVIGETYDFPQAKDGRKKTESQDAGKKLSYEQALRRVASLEKSLERTNIMLQDLQDEFEEQLESSKVKELAEFFAKLNSEKYGCILDELLVVRKGVDQLRKDNYELPIEINGLLIMVKKLIQFVRDNHIEPMMRIGMVCEVVAADIEFYNYEGSPFADPKEKKKIRVVSPGWVYKDKELQISRPKVKEEK